MYTEHFTDSHLLDSIVGHPDYACANNPIHQELCKRIRLIVTQCRSTLVNRFRLPIPQGFDQVSYETKVAQYFNILTTHADIYGLDFHYAWVAEQTCSACPICHVLILVGYDRPFIDFSFINEAENAWR